MQKPRFDTLVWDLDNTLWDWITYACETYPAMSELIAREAGVTRDRVERCMQNFYAEAGTTESSWLVQGLTKQGLFEGTDIKPGKLISALQRTFHSHRNQSLNLYEGATVALEAACSQGTKNVILTDAPAFHATSRIKLLGIDQRYFERMFALEDSLVGEIPPHFHKKFDDGRYGLDIPVERLRLEKPYTNLEDILHMTRAEIAERVAIIGDNDAKDMQLARRYGCIGFHALWGQPTEDQLEILKRFALPSVVERNASISLSSNQTEDRIVPLQSLLHLLAYLRSQ